MKETKVIRILAGVYFPFAAYAFYTLFLGLLAKASVLFEGTVRYWPGYIFYAGAVYVALAMLSLSYPSSEQQRIRIYKGGGFALVLLGFSAIAGIAIEVSLGVISWNTHGLSGLYPLDSFIGSFLLIAIGSLSYWYGTFLHKVPFDGSYYPSGFHGWGRFGVDAVAVIALFHVLFFFGSLLNLSASFDPASSHLAGLLLFYPYMLLPTVMGYFFFYGFVPLSDDKKWRRALVYSIVFLSIGIALAICFFVFQSLDPLYLTEGGTALLPVDFMGRLPYGLYVLFILNVLVPLGCLIALLIKRRRDNARLHTPA